MTGFDEAVAWIQNNAPDWHLARADTTLVAGYTVGAAAQRAVSVQLVQRHRVTPLDDVVLTGEGVTILEAVQAAIGHIR